MPLTDGGAGAPPTTSRPLRRIASAIFGYFAALVASSTVVAAAGSLTAEPWVLLLGQIVFWAALLLTVRLSGAVPAGDTVIRPRAVDVPIGIALGVGAQMLLLPLLYLPLRRYIDDEELARPARELVADLDGAALILTGIGVIAVAPIVEELFFRGLLLGALRERFGAVGAVVMSSAFFGATHFQPLQFIGLTAAGVVFAITALVAGRLAPAIAVHAAFNATTWVLLTVFS